MRPTRVRAPYRLDLTVSALRRLSTNLVDVLTPEGEYIRWLDDTSPPLIVRARQSDSDSLIIRVEGDEGEHPRAIALVRRMLGVETDLTRFYQSASHIHWLHPLVVRMVGVKPPRYPTLWEACVNAIVFQQISIAAASAIMHRLIAGLGDPLDRDGVRLYCFPDAARFQRAGDAVLRGTGLSAGKLAALRCVVDALEDGSLDEALLEERPSREAADILCRVKGIGPWTATVILLRGRGRLDVFPGNDSGVARNLALVAGSAPVDVEAVLERLGADRGMLYYHLLLARLAARGDLGRPSHQIIT